MRIESSNRELNVEEMYKLTMSPEAQKMSSQKGNILEIDAMLTYWDTDRRTGEEIRLFSIMNKDGEVYTTNSPTFIDEINHITDFCELMNTEVHKIKVGSGISKAGREYITPVYVG